MRCRFSSVSPLKGEDDQPRYEAYAATFEGEQAVVKLLYGSNESAVIQAAGAEAAVAPPPLAAESVRYVGAERVMIRKSSGTVEYGTGVHLVRGCLIWMSLSLW